MSMMTLMFKDTPVMLFDLKSGYVHILNHHMLPYGLSGRLSDFDFKGLIDENITEQYADVLSRVISKNYEALSSWISHRVAPYKHLSVALKGGDRTPKHDLTSMIKLTNAVSATDFFWIGMGDLHDQVHYIDTFKKTPEEIITENLSLLEFSQRVIAKQILNGNGKKKVEIRNFRNNRYLYASPLYGKVATEMAKVCGMCGFQYMEHDVRHVDGKRQFMRQLPITKDTYFVSAREYHKYCKANDVPFIENILTLDPVKFYEMCIFDYLTGNYTRNGEQWGFEVDVRGKIVGLSPIIDFTGCMSSMRDSIKDLPSPVRPKTTMWLAAHAGAEKLGFKIPGAIESKDFRSVRHYNYFIERAAELGVI